MSSNLKQSYDNGHPTSSFNKLVIINFLDFLISPSTKNSRETLKFNLGVRDIQELLDGSSAFPESDSGRVKFTPERPISHL